MAVEQEGGENRERDAQPSIERLRAEREAQLRQVEHPWRLPNQRGIAPAIVVALVLVGFLEMLGGVILCAALWPEAPRYGQELPFAAYVPSLVWLIAGFVSAIFTFAIAAVVKYLADIRDRLREIGLTGKGGPDQQPQDANL